jgi:hypothetical protein
MQVGTDDLKGWGGSILFHLLILLFMIVWKVGVPTALPEFIEVSWGTVEEVSQPSGPEPSGASAAGSPAEHSMRPWSPANLPERRLNISDEVLQVPVTKKLDATEAGSVPRASEMERLVGTKESMGGIGTDQQGDLPQRATGTLGRGVDEPRGAGMGGSAAGNSVSMSMLWAVGGTRKKVSGSLPSYPPGVNVEAQIKLEAVVTPRGTVKSLKPYQKANTRLEEAALQEVRLWRFEPLPASSPQVEQTCLITFNFQLQ